MAREDLTRQEEQRQEPTGATAEPTRQAAMGRVDVPRLNTAIPQRQDQPGDHSEAPAMNGAQQNEDGGAMQKKPEPPASETKEEPNLP